MATDQEIAQAQALGIVVVTYSDGRVKFSASNGDKYATLNDALHRNSVISLMRLGYTEREAESMVANKDAIAKALR